MVPVFEKLKQECREEGREEGKESSISMFIRNFRALNKTDDSIVDMLMKGFNLSQQDAEQRVHQASMG